MPWLYLVLNAAVISIPLAFSWHPKLRFADEWKAFVPACLLVLAGFIVWDIPFAQWGVWGFDERYILGLNLAGLPVEEWLFFVCIPYACTFTYWSLSRLGVDFVGGAALALTVVTALISAGLAVVYWGHVYTATTAVLVTLLSCWLAYRRPVWLSTMWSAYLLLLIPFVLTNGVLTGIAFWEYPLINTQVEAVTNHVVWYNNAENLGVRFLSIPFDDFFYGFLLIASNIALFEHLRSRGEVRTWASVEG